MIESFNRKMLEFGDLSSRWQRNTSDMNQLPAEDTTNADKLKLANWTDSFRHQLLQYGFKSLRVNQISISKDDYRPEHDGFDFESALQSALQAAIDLQNSISASDLIRTIWAYLLGMLEVSRSTTTNHPGLVVFDEPRQQSTKDLSFRELLKRASESGRFGQQVIFFTSEKCRTPQGVSQRPSTQS